MKVFFLFSFKYVMFEENKKCIVAEGDAYYQIHSRTFTIGIIQNDSFIFKLEHLPL